MDDDDWYASLNDTTIRYYNRRAAIGSMPPRQPKLAPGGREEHCAMVSRMSEVLRGRNVLEVACGAGTFTCILAEYASFITATDIAPLPLEKAREEATPSNVEYLTCDAFCIDTLERNGFSGALVAGFFHVCPLDRHHEFLLRLHSKLEPASKVFMLSSRPHSADAKSRRLRIEGRTDDYQRRQLSDGSEFVIVDNDLDAHQLRSIFDPWSTHLDVHIGRYWWWLSYEL